MKLPPILNHLFRILLGGIFIYASLDKIWEPGLFAKTIYNYRLLPDLLLHPVAILLPWLELITGIMLLANFFPKTSALVQLILISVFTLAIITAISRGLDIQCGCFSLDASGTRATWWKVGENLLLIALAAVVVMQTRLGMHYSLAQSADQSD